MPAPSARRALVLLACLLPLACEAPEDRVQPAPLFADTLEGELHVEEIERKGLVSIVRIDVLATDDPQAGADFIATCFARIAAARGFPYYVVLQRGHITRAKVPDAEPQAEQEYVLGFVRSPRADLMIEFPSYFDPAKHYAVEPAAGMPRGTVPAEGD